MWCLGPRLYRGDMWTCRKRNQNIELVLDSRYLSRFFKDEFFLCSNLRCIVDLTRSSRSVITNATSSLLPIPECEWENKDSTLLIESRKDMVERGGLTDRLYDSPSPTSAPNEIPDYNKPRSKTAACFCLPTLGFNSPGHLVVADKSICVHEHLCMVGVAAIG
jgi:hypothetical protein